LVIGERGAMYDPGDNGGNWRLVAEGGESFDPLPNVQYVANRGGHHGEFFRSVIENTPEDCFSNFPDYAGPFTETILLGNLAVWAASEADEWGEKVEWDAVNLVVTNVSSLQTPGVADLVKPVFREGHVLDVPTERTTFTPVRGPIRRLMDARRQRLLNAQQQRQQ